MSRHTDQCDHRLIERGDGHGHNYWECVRCHETWWIAPWVARGSR